MRWDDSILIGLRGLLVHKLRALLSALGIVFGVAAVIAMLAIGEGARQEAIQQIALLGVNNIRIKSIALTGKRLEDADRRYADGVTYDDARLIAMSIPSLVTVAPLKMVSSEVRFEGRQGSAQIVGTDPAYPDVTNFHVVRGRFIDAVDVTETKRVCVLGAEVKEQLFGYRNPIGANVRIGDTGCEVIGIMEAKLVREGRGGVIKLRNINRDIYVPVTTALRRFAGKDDVRGVEEIAVRVGRAESLGRATQLIKEVLSRKHRDVEDYEIVVPDELLAQAQRTQRLFNIVIGSIASISLLVGGIGIMNIMLANVSERTREIGIRRAVGATKMYILAQFLVETVLVCLAGGAIGILLGYFMGEIITRVAGWPTAFSAFSVFIAVATSATVGLVFGMFPARRAANLHPVQALRSE